MAEQTPGDATAHGHADGFLEGTIWSMSYRQTDAVRFHLSIVPIRSYDHSRVLYETVRALLNEMALCRLSGTLHMCSSTASSYQVEGHHL